MLGDCLSAAVPVPEALRAYESRRYARTAALVQRSRRAGRLAQAANPLVRAIRDAALKRLPPQLRLAELDRAVRWELG